MTDTPTLTKFNDGHFEWDSGGIFTWRMVYNSDGSYRGQWQTNILAGEGNQDEIFFTANPPNADGRFVPALTAEEMATALTI